MQSNDPHPEGMKTLDILAQSVAAKLGAVTCLISIQDQDALYALGHSMSPEPGDDRSVQASDTICKYTVRLQRPVKIPSVAQSPSLRSVPTVKAFGIAAYLGMPIILEDGACVGAICALSDHPRLWTDGEAEFLAETAKMASNQIDLYSMRAENRRLHGAISDFDRIISALAQSRDGARSVHSTAGEMLFANQAMLSELGLKVDDLDALPCALVDAAEEAGEQSDMMVRLDLGRRGERWLKVKCTETKNGLRLCNWTPDEARNQSVAVPEPNRDPAKQP